MLTLVSHHLCPYVQRAAIVLAEKGVPFARRDVDLGNKPGWFTAISPLGKTPLLIVDGTAIFESAVICEFLDETEAPRLHPADPLEKARHRSWVEFGSSILNSIGAYYSAPDSVALQAKREELQARFVEVEKALDPAGPWFGGRTFGLVDATFGPVFRYFDAFEAVGEPCFLDGLPRVQAWRKALSGRPSVLGAVDDLFAPRLVQFMKSRDSELGRRATDCH